MDEDRGRELTPTKLLFALIGLALQVVVGFLFIASGLVAPPYAVIGFMLLWAGGFIYGLSRWRERTWIALAVPLVLFAVWLVALLLGDAFLGWTA